MRPNNLKMRTRVIVTLILAIIALAMTVFSFQPPASVAGWLIDHDLILSWYGTVILGIVIIVWLPHRYGCLPHARVPTVPVLRRKHPHRWINVASAAENTIEISDKLYTKLRRALRLPVDWHKDPQELLRLVRATAARGVITVSGKTYTKMECLIEALEIDKKFTDAWNYLGLELQFAGENGHATVGSITYTMKSCFLEALRWNLKCTEAWINLGCITPAIESVIVAGTSHTAIECFVKAVLCDPDNPYAWNNFGKAIRERLTCCKTNKPYTNAHHLVKFEGDGSVTHLADGTNFTITVCYANTVRCCPSYPRAWFHLGKSVGENGSVTVGNKVYTQRDCFVEELHYDPDYRTAWSHLSDLLEGCEFVTVAGNTYTKGQCLEKSVGGVTPRGDGAMEERRFGRLYSSKDFVPRNFDELMTAVGRIIIKYATFCGEWDGESIKFFSELQKAAIVKEMQNPQGLNSFGARLKSFAVRLWTSALQHNGREFCSMLNQVIQNDDPSTIHHAVTFTHAINEFLLTRNSAPITWPPSNRTHRGTAMPREFQTFFVPGVQYRAKMFVATSSSEAVANKFVSRLADPSKSQRPAFQEPTLWTFHFDVNQRCVHVNFIDRNDGTVGDEDEFLFVPYSVFTVRRVVWSENLSANPHQIEVDVCPDNRKAPPNLPLAPWS